MQTKKKYIFFDIDGTLTSHTKRDFISESTLQAIDQLKAKGHFVSLATGRSVFLAKEVAPRVNINNLVCEGGNGLIINGELHSYEPLNQEKVITIIEKCEEVGLSWAISNEDSPVVLTKDKSFVEHMTKVPFITRIEYDETYDFRNETSARRVFIENKPEVIQSINEIKEIGLMVYHGSLFGLVEPDDKYKGIKKMVEFLGGQEEDIIVFGDGMNDIKMFEKAAFSVAMGNAEEELKKLASYITDDADSDGIYNACRHLQLID